MEEKLMCQVCEKEEAVGVASCLAAQPISIAYGKNCLHFSAEALWIVASVVYCCNGPEYIAAWFWGLLTFKDGIYLSAEQVYGRQKTMDLM